MDIVTLLVQLVSGAVGGNVAGNVMKKLSLGTVGNSIVGILGGWTMWKVVAKPPRPQAERIAEPQQAQAPAPRN